MEITIPVWGNMTGRISTQQVAADIELHKFCGIEWHWPFRNGDDFAQLEYARIKMDNFKRSMPRNSRIINAQYGTYGPTERG